MKKLTAKDWDVIQKNRPARRYIQSVEEGTVRVVFDSELVQVEPGEEDLLGFVWEPKGEKKWTKVEAKVTINGEPKIYSLGGLEFSFIGDFISCCRQNDLQPDNIVGAVFDITKTGDWTQEIKFIGKSDKVSNLDKPLINITENLKRDAIDAINNLKENSPDLAKVGFSINDFLKVLSIRANIKTDEGKNLLPELEKDNLITIVDGKVTLP